jgi:hypothetical protein
MLEQPPGFQQQTNPPKQPTLWYASAMFTVLMLVLFFPIGVALMWAFRPEWTMRAKAIVTGVFGTILLVIISSPSSPPPQAKPSVPVAASAVPKPLTPSQIAAQKKAAQKRAHDAKVAAAKHAREQKLEAERQREEEAAAERAEAEAAREQAAKGMGLTYDAVMSGLTDSYNLTQGEPMNGRLNYSGPSTNPIGSVIQVVGDHDNVWEASMTVMEATADNAGDQDTADTTNVANAARMLLFIKNVAPDWDGATDWVTATMKRAQTHPGKHYSVTHGERRYMLMCEDLINTTTLQVTRADNVED